MKTLRLILAAFVLAGCADNGTGPETVEDQLANGMLVSATQEWWTGSTNLRVEVENTGTVSGVYNLDIWARDSLGNEWLARTTPPRSLPMKDVPVGLWKIQGGEVVTVTLIHLYTMTGGQWILTDSLTESEIGTDG